MQEFDITLLFFQVVDKVVLFSESNFFTTFISAGAGAGFGAWSAQKMAQKSTNKTRLLEEISAINSCICIAFDISNSHLSFKQQHISGLYVNYNKLKEQYIELKSKPAPKTGTFELNFNFMTLNPQSTSKEKLSDQMYDKFSASTKSLVILSTLLRVIESFERSLELRNTLINKVASTRPSMAPEDMAILYFGLEDKSGHTDTNFPDSIQAIYDGCDDCIFFAKYLIATLTERGKRLVKDYGEDAPKIVEPNFSYAFLQGLIPIESKYIDWLKMFD